MANGKTRIDFQTEPGRYRHWRLKIDGDVATLVMDVDEKGGLFDGYELKLNSYDLGVDIELADALECGRRLQPRLADAMRKNLAISARVFDRRFMARAHEHAQVVDLHAEFRAARSGVFHDARDAVARERAHEARLGKIVVPLGQHFIEAGLARQQLA